MKLCQINGVTLRKVPEKKMKKKKDFEVNKFGKLLRAQTHNMRHATSYSLNYA